MERENAIQLTLDLLRKMVEREGSDLFITVGFPPAVKVHGEVLPISDEPLTVEQARALVSSVMRDQHSKEFDATQECNFAIAPPEIGRFRVNAYVQRGHPAMVLRMINTEPPTLESLALPKVMESMALTRRGLVIVVGATGSGKSTTLAALVNHRNENSHGHIVTIEDPIEFVHPHKGCVVSQREVGIDTEDWGTALKNVLRQAPDVILFGEIRDRETMGLALQFAQTGHLALATLHATNANQALDRALSFFSEERQPQLLMDLSLNLKAVISQRLLAREDGRGRIAAIEIMLNSPLIADLIARGEVGKIKEIMQRSTEEGMQTFDEALFNLYESSQVGYKEALRNADSINDLRHRIKLKSKRAQNGNSSKEPQDYTFVEDPDDHRVR